MRTSQMIVTVATHTGWPLEYIGRLPYRQLVYLVAEIDYQQRCEAYRIEYRIGQVMCILANDKTHKYKPEQFVGDEPKELEVTMAGKPEPQVVILGDGKEYTLPIFDANLMESIEEELNQKWEIIFKNMRAKQLKVIIYHMLKLQHPDLTLEAVGALLTIDAINEVSKVFHKLV